MYYVLKYLTAFFAYKISTLYTKKPPTSKALYTFHIALRDLHETYICRAAYSLQIDVSFSALHAMWLLLKVPEHEVFLAARVSVMHHSAADIRRDRRLHSGKFTDWPIVGRVYPTKYKVSILLCLHYGIIHYFVHYIHITE